MPSTRWVNCTPPACPRRFLGSRLRERREGDNRLRGQGQTTGYEPFETPHHHLAERGSVLTSLGSNRGEYLGSMLGRSIYSSNLYQMLFYND